VEAGGCEPPQETCFLEDYPFGDASKATHPATCVNWYRAQAYCEWARARLPTEAEWEYAARGNSARAYPWGNDVPSCDLANYSGCVGDTTPVGSYPAGASWCGALDMAGNVWEWVADGYDSDYYSNSSYRNPTGPSSSLGDDGREWRTVRGGSWSHIPYDIRPTTRSGWPAQNPISRYGGFRCARDSQ
jgi:formylglycine-generating enzyme required for sulfatase activity